MRKLLEKLSKEKLIDIIEDMINVTRDNGLLPYYNKFKDMVEDTAYCMSSTEAKEIVLKMKPYGEVYAMDAIQSTLSANGIPIDERTHIHYYLVMNMYANDARHVAEEWGVPLDKFCFMMAKSFIQDMDAPKYKVEKYFKE